MFVKFKFDSPDKIIKKLQNDLKLAVDSARNQYAVFLRDTIVEVSPEDTQTFASSWTMEKSTKGVWQIKNKLPAEYIGDGKYHRQGQRIVAPYNLYILEGEQAGAPQSYVDTSHPWAFRNTANGKLLDVNVLLWKFNQGALGLNPYTLLNALFIKEIRRKI